MVGEGLLLGERDREMRAVGALSSFLEPSTMALLVVVVVTSSLSGDEEEAGVMTAVVVGGSVFNLMGTKALRISSGADSLPDSLGLLGGVLDGLVGIVACALELLLDFGGSVVAAYSAGYLTWSNGYDGSTDGGNVGGNRSVDGIGIVPARTRKKRNEMRITFSLTRARGEERKKGRKEGRPSLIVGWLAGLG